VLQKPPLRAKATWRDHGIPSRWPEKVDRKTHPHAKPAGLIARLIGAVTAPGDLVVDPAAGSFIVMRVGNDMGRNFVGCDIACQPPTEIARPRMFAARLIAAQRRGSRRELPLTPSLPSPSRLRPRSCGSSLQ
jgi:hypothetical protein